MTLQTVTVMVADHVYEPAQRLAEAIGYPVEAVLTALLDLSIAPFHPAIDLDKPLTGLSNDEVMAVTQVQMAPERERRLRELNHLQAERALSAGDQAELRTLMCVYEIGMRYRAQALQAVVQRGLQPLLPT